MPTSELDLYKNSFYVNAALAQIVDAKDALNTLDTKFTLAVDYGDHAFDAGVWGGAAVTVVANSLIQFDGMGEENPIWFFNLSSSLTSGAETKLEIINAGAGVSVIWNIGGGLTMVSGSSFVGAAFVTGAVAGAT